MSEKDQILNTSLMRVRNVIAWVGILVVLIVSTFVLVGKWSVLDSLYMTVISLTTISFGTPHDILNSNKFLYIPISIISFVSMTLLTAYLTSFIIENDLYGHFEEKRTKKMLKKLQNHVIVCGSGSMAEVIVSRLLIQKIKVVIVDDKKQKLESLKENYPEALILFGNPTNEIVLTEAKLMSAKYVVAALDSEVDNLLVSITCKDIGSNIKVFARSNDFSIGNRMRKAQVDEVITPCKLCGDKVADLILSYEAEQHKNSHSHGVTKNSSQPEVYAPKFQVEQLPQDREILEKLMSVGLVNQDVSV